MSDKLYYFGTDLVSAGHYFWELSDCLNYSIIHFKDIPFNPEQLTSHLIQNGDWVFQNIIGYSILAIKGSCADRRDGCKSVFWVKKDITEKALIDRIKNTPAALGIISQMPFYCNILNPEK